jgi:hypothetical protein
MKLLRLLIAFSLIHNSLPIHASESDNYNLRELDTSFDTVDAINEMFNTRIEKTIKKWKSRKNESEKERNIRMANKVFFAINRGTPNTNGSKIWFNRAGLPKLEYDKAQGIYEHLPSHYRFYHSFRPYVYIIYANGVPFGIDKMGHFFSVGYMMYIKERNDEVPGSSYDWAIGTEWGAYGYGVGGVFSNGDLVADYEGYLFFRSLSEEIDGKKPIIGWNDKGEPFLQRKVDLRQHINIFWSEAANPSIMRDSLEESLAPARDLYCDLYQSNPEWFAPNPEEEARLMKRYEVIKLDHRKHWRLDSICNQ